MSSPKSARSHDPHDFSGHFGSISSVSRWLIWFAILALTCAAVGAAFFLQDEYEGLINKVMCGTILTLAAGLIIKGFFDALFLQRETSLASHQTSVLETVDNFDDFFARTEHSLFRSHIRNLYIISQSRRDFSQDVLIDILHSRLTARNRVAELFSGILITLGLIGTILGLIIMMDSLSFVISEFGGSDDLLNKIADPETGPLGGLGVAFYTTLIGSVFGGVVLRVLTGVIDSNTTVYMSHIAELTEVYVLPHLGGAAAEQTAGPS